MNKTTRMPKTLGKKLLRGTLAAGLLGLTLNAQAADKVRFQLDWLPGGDKAPIYVGLSKGIFEEAGLDVSVASGRGSTDAITKIASGNADVGLSDLVSLLMARAENDVPVSGVYSVFSQAPHAFFVPADSGIDSVADVAGKRLATSPFSSSNLFLPLLLDLNGVEEDSVKVLKADPGALNPMLLSGNTDVVISWITDSVLYQTQAQQAGVQLKELPWYDAGLEFYSTSVIAADRFLEERPDVARRFVAAYAKAIEYTWEHPQESGEIVHEMVPEVDAKTATNTILSIRPLVYNSVSEHDGMGAFSPERLATSWKWVSRAQEHEASGFDPETAITRAFMPEK